MTKIKIYL